LEQSGVTVTRSFEIDPTCCHVARANFSHQIVQCDIQQKLVLDGFGCHAMVFTYPCNRYAAISAIHGMRVGDALYLHAFRHLALYQPELFWLENVQGMLKFPVVMEAMSKLPGYYITVFCPVQTEL
jgi:DNA (cytosine-5)-methyltransferase 1